MLTPSPEPIGVRCVVSSATDSPETHDHRDASGDMPWQAKVYFLEERYLQFYRTYIELEILA